MTSNGREIAWWKRATVYQIYPRSFMDSNGDGIGDLPGVISRLDYLKDLGIDVIWICPMYRSPQDDNGYDISDYQAIHQEFGTMEDFDRLLSEVHRRGMRLILDLVINHTSDEHPWFVESCSARSSPKRDWYIWRDGNPAGGEPNNWESIFGGSAWKFHESTGQYFLHLFSGRQPDLNWENHDMRQEVYRMIRWWLDKGIDGFRIDAVTHMKKEPSFSDLPNPRGLSWVPSWDSHRNYPGLLSYVDDLCAETFSRYDIMTVGEANGVSAREAESWVGPGHKRFNMLFQFEHLDLWSTDSKKRVELEKLKEVFSRWQNALEGRGWNALFVENHDVPRVVSKWGHTGDLWRESATAIAAFYFLMKGTPFIYQGQEIGMTNTVFRGIQDFNDVSAKNLFRIRREGGIGDEAILAELAPTSRDNARTPMQWSSEPGAGFTSGPPWLGINPNFSLINVESQLGDPRSILNFYRNLIRLRRESDVLLDGRFDLLDHPQMFVYSRSLGAEKIVVATNLSLGEVSADFPGEVILGNYPDGTGIFRPFECRVIRAN